MTAGDQKKIAKVLLKHYGTSFAKESGNTLKNTPASLFQWLCASLLLSARIRSDIAVEAAKALKQKKWTTARKMGQSTWQQRVNAVHRAGYARYDERTATMLGETSDKLQDDYNGDLRKLREKAQQNPEEERRLLKQFKGIGDVGVDIFFREIQAEWKELYPFVDDTTLKAAHRVGLKGGAQDLSKLVSREQFPILLAAVMRVKLHKDYDRVRELTGKG